MRAQSALWLRAVAMDEAWGALRVPAVGIHPHDWGSVCEWLMVICVTSPYLSSVK